MASAAEIRTRINSIAETRKVTDAMYMISSVKMRKARREIESTKPYFDAIRLEIGEMLHYIPENNDRYFKINDPDGIQGRALLLITSDKGLAGNYNQMAIRTAQEYLEKHPDTFLFVIGEYGRQYFNSRKFTEDTKTAADKKQDTGAASGEPDTKQDTGAADEDLFVNEAGKALLKRQVEIVKNFSYAAAFPTIWEARRRCAELLGYYNSDRVDEINVIYTHSKAGRSGECRTNCLLPLDRTTFYDGNEFKLAAGKKYYPDTNTVLDGVVPSYLTGFIYSALVDSYCSEQEARMTAMNSAGKNADEMLRKLKIQYNGIRQAAITREMTEIAAGAKALKKKVEKAKRLKEKNDNAGRNGNMGIADGSNATGRSMTAARYFDENGEEYGVVI